MSVIFLHKTLDTSSYSGIALSWSVVSADPSYPLTNLQDQHKNTLAKSDADTKNQTLRVNLGSAYAIDSLAILNHNWTALADTRISFRSATDGTYASTTNIISDASSANQPIYGTFNSVSKQYLDFLFDSSVDLTAIPYASQIFIGTKFTHAFNYAIGNSEETGYEVLKQRSWDGTDSAYLMYATKRKYWGSVKFQIITSAYKTNFDTFFESVKGGYRPFMMSTDSGTTWYYVRVAEDKISYINKGADYWETTLNFYEQIG